MSLTRRLRGGGSKVQTNRIGAPRSRSRSATPQASVQKIKDIPKKIRIQTPKKAQKVLTKFYNSSEKKMFDRPNMNLPPQAPHQPHEIYQKENIPPQQNQNYQNQNFPLKKFQTPQIQNYQKSQLNQNPQIQHQNNTPQNGFNTQNQFHQNSQNIQKNQNFQNTPITQKNEHYSSIKRSYEQSLVPLNEEIHYVQVPYTKVVEVIEERKVYPEEASEENLMVQDSMAKAALLIMENKRLMDHYKKRKELLEYLKTHRP